MYLVDFYDNNGKVFVSAYGGETKEAAVKEAERTAKRYPMYRNYGLRATEGGDFSEVVDMIRHLEFEHGPVKRIRQAKVDWGMVDVVFEDGHNEGINSYAITGKVNTAYYGPMLYGDLKHAFPGKVSGL